MRNSRDTKQPNPVEFAGYVIHAGAHGVTIHPRPDQRHIRFDDCIHLSKSLSAEINIEGNPFSTPASSNRGGVNDYPGFMSLIEVTRPDQVTLVPDGKNQLTSDHGFDIEKDGDRLLPVIEQLQNWGIRVC